MPEAPLLKDYFQINEGFPWSFRVQVMTKDPSFQCYSPSHKLRRIDQTIPGCFVFELDPEFYQEISEAFIFRYRVENAEAPQLLLTRNDKNYNTPFAMSMSYNPSERFEEAVQKTLGTWGSSDEEEDLLSKYPADYIFVVDRSGSMGGQRIKLAREALLILLKSLTEGSSFNIVSFGSEYEFMFKKSMPVNEENIHHAIQEVKTFESDFGGTSLYPCVEKILNLKQKDTALNAKIFILTDG